jgi:hypothetical protein
VGDPATQADNAEIPKVNTSVSQSFMKPCKERLIGRPDRTDHDENTILQVHTPNELFQLLDDVSPRQLGWL